LADNKINPENSIAPAILKNDSHDVPE